MRPATAFSIFVLPILGVALATAAPPCAGAQEVDSEVREAYFRAVGEYFQAPLDEVTIIGEWNLTPDEVPVVFFLAQRAGVSPDALIGLRGGGRSWQEVAEKFGIQTLAFHLPLPAEADKGPLARAYEAFDTRTGREWQQIRLDDAEITAMVNLRVLTAQTGIPPLQILRHFQEAGSFAASYPRLLPGTGE